MILDQGISRIIGLLASDIGQSQSGTDGTTPAATDTALGAPIVDTLNDSTIEIAGKLITVTSTISSTQGIGEDIVEQGTYVNGNTELFDRIVHALIAKTDNTEVTYIKTFYVDRAD